LIFDYCWICKSTCIICSCLTSKIFITSFTSIITINPIVTFTLVKSNCVIPNCLNSCIIFCRSFSDAFSKCCCLICALVNCNGSGVILFVLLVLTSPYLRYHLLLMVISSFCLLYHSLVIGYLYKYVAKSEKTKRWK
jgi:hypothetical protein